MAKKPGTGEWYDWQSIRTEYITSKISVRKLAEKHGIRLATVSERCRKEGWVDLRKLFIDKTIQKTIEKESTKTANKLAKELAVADKISDVLTEALKDAEQFRRHIVQEKYFDDDGGMAVITEEKVFKKYDMRSIQQAMSALKMVEEMKRSIENIQTMSELNKQKNDERKLKMEEERLELEKQKRNTFGFDADDGQHGVIMLAPVLTTTEPEEDKEGDEDDES